MGRTKKHLIAPIISALLTIYPSFALAAGYGLGLSYGAAKLQSNNEGDLSSFGTESTSLDIHLS